MPTSATATRRWSSASAASASTCSKPSRCRAPRRIVAVDTEPKKEALARQFGATHFLDGKATDIVEQIAAIRPYSDSQVRGPFNAGGMDWAFDVVAHPTVTMNALESLDWGGTCVVIGVPAADARYEGIYTRLTQVDRGLIGTRAGSYSPHRDMPFIIDLYRRGLVKLDELVSAHLPARGVRDRHPRDGSRQPRPRRPHVLDAHP